MKVLDGLTPRQIFNKVSGHLLKQNARSIEDGVCKYRHGELRCAVGCLIPDDAYTPKMEGHSIYDLVFKEVLGRDYEKLAVLDALREVHDSHHPERWREKLAEVKAKLRKKK